MANIAAVIITKNEEINIGRCLKSVLQVTDEIVVVDSMSTDRTEEICRSYENVRFVQTEWRGFSATKNFGNDLVKAPYILSLDADEELSPELISEINKIKASLTGEEAFYFNRITNYCGKWIYHSGWLPDYQMRLFPKGKGRWNKAQVHENVEFSQPIKIKKMKAYLNHYSYYTINEHVDRAKSYTSLGAQKVLDKGTRFLLAKSVINPFFRFLSAYFLKQGFRDGAYGFCICVIGSFTVFLKYFKAWQAKKYKVQP